MRSDNIEDWSFQELVDYCAGEILKDLLAGKFRTSVHSAMALAMQWQDARDTKQAKKKAT